MSFRKSAKRVFASAMAGLFKRQNISAEQLVVSTAKRILIVRPHNQMGDMICATPAFRAIRETYPEADITLICAPINHDAVRCNPHVNRVIVFDKRKCRNPVHLFNHVKSLRAIRPDLAFVLSSVSYSVTSTALAVASGASLIVGNESASFGFDITSKIYSLELPSFPEIDCNAVLHNLAPLQAVGISTADLSTVVVSSVEEIELANKYLADISTGCPVWVLHPGAGKAENSWPVERFADIADRAVQHGATLVVLQGPADVEVISRFKELVTAKVNYMSVTTVGVCGSILQQSERFICNDTGLMHLAGAVGVPSIALFGKTDPAIWGPINPVVGCLRGNQGILNNLEIDFVWNCWLELPIREDIK